MLYAVYIVMIKRKVDREDKLDIPMFFGKNKNNAIENLNSMCDSVVCFHALNCMWVVKGLRRARESLLFP